MEQERVWDKIAGKWAKYKIFTSREVSEFLEGKEGKILDMGCGSGRNFVTNKGLEIYGVDFSEEMLKHAKKRANELSIDVKLSKSEGDEILFDDNFFDYGICFAVLHCVDSSKKREKMIEELFRVLKPGAEALISVWGRGSPRVKNKDKECFVSWKVGEKKYERYTYLFDEGEIQGMVKSVGFEIIKQWEDRNINVIVRKSS